MEGLSTRTVSLGVWEFRRGRRKRQTKIWIKILIGK